MLEIFCQIDELFASMLTAEYYKLNLYLWRQLKKELHKFSHNIVMKIW
jgi:hypothetical protein